MATHTCPKCKNQRWEAYLFRWDRNDNLVGAWKPFDRARWSAMGDMEISMSRGLKIIRPCGECNTEGLAPWAAKFKPEKEGAPEAPEFGGVPS